MAGFTLWTDELVEAVNYTIVGGESIDLLTSVEIPNTGGAAHNSLKLTIDYSLLVPQQGSGRIGAIVESKDDNNNWFPLAYQFSPVANVTSQAGSRIIVVQPNIDTFNTGIDDIVYPVDSEVARISRQQGNVPSTSLRVRILLTDSDPAGAAAFESVTINGTGELYSV